MGITQLNFEGKNKVETAIALLRAYVNPDERYYGAFSGGKDSVVIEDLSTKAGVPVDWHYCASPIDPPQIHQFIKEYYPHVQWDYYARGWWQTVVRKGLPMRQSRWCCEIIKEAGGKGRCVIVGNRREEGAIRKHQKCFEEDKKYHKTFLRPILDWNTGEIWEYIEANDLPYCSLYDNGFKRLGCVLCPFSRDIKREMEYFPKIVKLWQLACDRIVAARLKSGKEYKYQFQTGEELFNWWIKRS